MEVRRNWDKRGAPLSYSEALAYEIGDAALQVDSMTQTLGNLIEMLHVKGLISQEEAMTFLPKYYEVYKSPDSR